MGGVYSVGQIKKILAVVIDLGELADKFKNSAGSIVAKLSAVLSLAISDSGDFISLASLDVETLKKEFSELDAADKAEVLAFLNTKLVLEEKDLESKIENGVAILVELESVIEKAIAFAKGAPAAA